MCKNNITAITKHILCQLNFNSIYNLYFCPLRTKKENMKVIPGILFVMMIWLFASCSGEKQITAGIQNGENDYQLGKYNEALAEWEKVIAWYEQHDKQKECPVYAEAADASSQLGQTDKAIDYFKKDIYSSHVNEDTYFNLARLYREIDNLSKELVTLETYVDKYPEGLKIGQVRHRLFELYVESDNWQKADDIWSLLSADDQANPEMLEGLLTVNNKLDNDSACDTISAELLELNENNLAGLEWLAQKYFWKAENLYQDELKAYDKNKTNRQYNHLLKALDVVTADFKTSLKYFYKIYDQEPTPATAKYIGDIYNRLDDKKKADYYYGLSEKAN